jgi:tetratricopeptide (TPR) repeat protein
MFGCATVRGGIDYDQALRAFKNHHYDIAETHLDTALRKNPGEERAASLLGWVRFKQGRIEEARQLFTQAYQRNPDNMATVEGLGWIYYLDGEDEKAEKAFKKLIQFTEDHLGNPSWPYYELNDREFIQSMHSEANYALGLIAKRRGMWKSARTFFERALNQFNQFISHDIIAKELADTLFHLEEYKAAAIFYKQFLSENPNDLSLLNRYAWCLYQIGNLAEAKSLYLRSKELSLLFGEYYQKPLGNQSVTQRIYAKRIAEPYYGLALIYAKEKRFIAAQGELATALKISPFFHHSEEIVLLLDQHPEWREKLQFRSQGRPLP